MSEDFKTRMKRIRIRAGFSSQQLAADAIGCPRGTVGMWEAPSSPVQSIGNEWLFEVARAYKVHPAWINKLDSEHDGFPWEPMTRRHLEGAAEEISPSFARLLTAANIDQAEPMTQSAIANELGVDRSTVAAWKLGGVSKDGAEFAQQKFGVPASWILYGTGLQLSAAASSQPARLDPDVLRLAAQTARAIAARTVDPEQDAELLAKAYDAIVELAGDPPPPAVIVDLLDWYRGRSGSSGVSGEGATGSTGPAAGGKPARKASA